jgi:hypothetical protein
MESCPSAGFLEPCWACGMPYPACFDWVWTCEDITDITMEEMFYWDSDMDGAITLDDNID